MPAPNLLNPIWITIKPLERDGMVFDDEVRAPIAGARATQVIEIQAQFQELDSDLINQQTGVVEPTKGYIVVRQVDLRVRNVVLKRGDQIVKIGRGPLQQAADLYLTLPSNAATWGDQGGPTLLLWYFSDRKPTRQQGDL